MGKNDFVSFRCETGLKAAYVHACNERLIDSNELLRLSMKIVAYRRQEDMDRFFDLLRW